MVDGQQENYEQQQIRNLETDVRQLPNGTGTMESSTSESISWQETGNQGGNWQEQIAEEGGGNWQHSPFNQTRDGRAVNDWPQEPPRNLAGEDPHPREAQRIWHEDNTRETAGNWSDGPSGVSRNHRGVPVRRFNRFHPPDDDNVYSMELRELLSR